MFRSIRRWFLAPKASKRRNRIVLGFDVLEDRMVPASRIVNILEDPGPPPTPDKPDPMSLRRAINELNSFPNESNSITFASPLQGEITLAFALPPILVSMSIDGGPDIMPGLHRIGVTRDNANPLDFRIFNVVGSPTSARYFDLRNIRVSGGYDTSGGGILINAGVTAYVYNTAVFTNRADDRAGGGLGGGIRNDGTLVVDNSTITSNSSSFLGGGIYNTGFLLVQYNTWIAGNHADDAGGGIFNAVRATAETNNAQIQMNSAGNAVLNITGTGGGIYNEGTLQMWDSLLDNNFVLLGGSLGGGLFSDAGSQATLNNVTITRNSANNANNDGTGGGFYVRTTASLSLSGCTLSANQADVALSRGGFVEVGATYSWTGAPPFDPVGGPGA